jgi:hypothetical protein
MDKNKYDEKNYYLHLYYYRISLYSISNIWLVGMGFN